MSKAVQQKITALRIQVLQTLAPEDFVTATKEKCLSIQGALGFGTEWGVLLLPSDWVPRGTAQNNRILQLTARMAATTASAADQAEAVLQLTRFALLYFLVPMPTARGMIIPSPTTWKDNMRVLALMASQGISKPGRREGHVFSHLETQEVALLNRGRRIDGVLAKLDYAASRYGWQDVPQSLSYGELEKDRRGAESPKSPPASGPGYLPLPDAFVAEAGWRLLWLIEKLGPPLLACARQMVLVCEATPLQVPGENYFTLKSRRITALERLLKDWTWTSPSDGAVLSGLPFELALGGKGKQRSLFAWPPRLPGDVVELVKLLQVAHLFVFLMSTGGRISEALSLERGCIFETSDEVSRAQGRTYKLVFNDNGQVRDWPLPAVGTSALRQQQELAEALDALGWLYTLEDADTLSELLAMAKDFNRVADKGRELGLSADEVAFYDALETNEASVRTLGPDVLKTIARELTERLRNSVSVDWQVRENVRAQIRKNIRTILKRHKYPLDHEARAVETVVLQAEVLSEAWTTETEYA